MISLPIIFREFRVAARHKRTFVLRAACVGILMIAALMFLHELPQGMTAPGKWLLLIFGWLLLFLVALVAPALSASCISDENHHGTLGLLFLTKLRSSDIVLGKYVSMGFDLALLLLAATPLLFMPVFLGGVSWHDATNTFLNTASLLLLALAIGIFCSAHFQSSATSIVMAYALLIVFNVVAVMLPEMKHLAGLKVGYGSEFWFLFPDTMKLASPFWTLMRGLADDAWVTLLVDMIASLLLVILTVRRLPCVIHAVPFQIRFWRKAQSRNAVTLPGWSNFRRRTALDRNPLLWLHFTRRKNRWWLQWVLSTCLVMGVAFALQSKRHLEDAAWLTILFGLLTLFCLKILMVIHVARSFATQKEDGRLQLLLVAPFTNTELVTGQLRAAIGRYILLWASVFGVIVACGLTLVTKMKLTGDEPYAIGFFFLGTATSSLTWAIPLAGRVGVWSKSPRQAVTNAIIGATLLVWLANALTYGLFYILVDSGNGGNFVGKLELLTCIKVGADLFLGWLLYLSLTEQFRAFATRQ